MSAPLYPNIRDPCNNRLLQEVSLPHWENVPLEKERTYASEGTAEKYNEFYELQRRDMEGFQEQHQQSQQHHDLSQAAHLMTSLPQRAQTAPLHSQSAHAPASPTSCTLPSFTAQRTMGTPPRPHQTQAFAASSTRQALPPVRRNPQRHSTTAVPGDIESSSSGLRPRVNYKSLYTRGSNHSNLSNASSASSSCGSVFEEDQTASTMCGSSRRSFQHDCPASEDPAFAESPIYEHHEHDQPGEEPATMEIAPNVRVAVRSSQESYKAVQSGDYTVATCFACTSTIVCVNDAAYVLCPDCQVVSPLGYGAATHDASKKDDPYGIGTGLKREWVNEWVGSI